MFVLSDFSEVKVGDVLERVFHDGDNDAFHRCDAKIVRIKEDEKTREITIVCELIVDGIPNRNRSEFHQKTGIAVGKEDGIKYGWLEFKEGDPRRLAGCPTREEVIEKIVVGFSSLLRKTIAKFLK